MICTQNPRHIFTNETEHMDAILYCTGGIHLFMGRDSVEFAKRAKHKTPAMQVRDECYTKNHLFLIM